MHAWSAGYEERDLALIWIDDPVWTDAELVSDRRLDFFDLIAKEAHRRVGDRAVTAEQDHRRGGADVESHGDWVIRSFHQERDVEPVAAREGTGDVRRVLRDAEGRQPVSLVLLLDTLQHRQHNFTGSARALVDAEQYRTICQCLLDRVLVSLGVGERFRKRWSCSLWSECIHATSSLCVYCVGIPIASNRSIVRHSVAMLLQLPREIPHSFEASENSKPATGGDASS